MVKVGEVKGYGTSMYYDQPEGRKFEAKISVGAAMLNNNKKNHAVADITTGLSAPVGERAAIEADANVQLGKEVTGGGGEARFVFDANPRLSINAGAGVHYNNFDQQMTQQQYEFNSGNMSGEKPFYKDEYSFAGEGLKYHKTRDTERTIYGTAGVDYKLSDKFTLSGGVALGKKLIQGEEYGTVEQGKYTYVVKEGGYEQIEPALPDEPPMYTEIPAQTATQEKTVIQRNLVENSAFTGNVRLGASYNITKNLQAGVVGSIPLNNQSDGFVGAKLTLKF